MSDTPAFDFSSLDSLTMLLMITAAHTIDKKLSVDKQATCLSEFYASFLCIRSEHEQRHITEHRASCPFCMSVALSLALNRDKQGE